MNKMLLLILFSLSFNFISCESDDNSIEEADFSKLGLVSFTVCDDVYSIKDNTTLDLIGSKSITHGGRQFTKTIFQGSDTYYMFVADVQSFSYSVSSSFPDLKSEMSHTVIDNVNVYSVTISRPGVKEVFTYNFFLSPLLQ